MSDLLQTLLAAAGDYHGEGVNHEGEAFTCIVSLTALFGKAALLAFSARTVQDINLHQEHGLIVPAAPGQVSMTSVNTNMPFAQDWSGAMDQPGLIRFSHGDINFNTGFREILTLDCSGGAAQRIAFAWAMPGQAMAARSSATLSRS